jgi:ABC-type transport system involved in cytochrome c biogenesis permease subunit
MLLKKIRSRVFSCKNIILFFLIIATTYPESSSSFNIGKAGSLIVLDDGRKKPLDSYARKKLIQISGKSKIAGLSALEWLIKLMMYPGAIDTTQCFRITNPEVIDALGIQGAPKRRYRYTELYGAFEKCQQIANAASHKVPSDLLPYERDILQLWNNLQEYNAIGSTFSAFEPFNGFAIHDTSLAVSLQLEVDRPYSYSDLIASSTELSVRMKQVKNVYSLTGSDSELVRIVKAMYAMNTQMGKMPPYLIPVTIGGISEWCSPWNYLCKSGTAALNDHRMQSFVTMKNAYLNGDAAGFNSAVEELTKEKNKDIPYPGLEILYNDIKPFFWAKLIFAFAGIITLCSMFYNKKWILRSGFALIGAGFLLQTVGLLLRVLIQMRPPLASLYETFVFVSWIIVILGIVLEVFQRRGSGMMISSFGGFLFLFISGRYVSNGDSFGIIAAVLNSSFWLTTHIVTISIGYAGCLIAGLLGHVFIIQKALGANEKVLKSSDYAVYIFVLVGLAFTVAGTVLGGMWADQAWGRFWGWDPKENGALLIILWGTLIIHARKSKVMGPALTSAAAVFGVIMVMLAWVGVNLLGIGLHSYGFTYSGLGLLVGVSLFELIFLLSFGIHSLSAQKKF